MSVRTILAIAALSTATLAVLAAFAFQQHAADRPIELQAGTSLPQPRPLPDFALLDQHGRPFTRATLSGRWTLLFAGFTHCPDICPATLATLAGVDARLQAVGIDVHTVFITVDPERDDPDTLNAYVSHFSPRLIGATGELPEIDTLMAGLGLVYIKVPGGGGSYTMDHSAALALVDPRGRVTAYFRPPLSPDVLAADLAALAGLHP